jgi:hypothetical protein
VIADPPPACVYARIVIEIGSRTRKLAAPPAIVWEPLVNPSRPGGRPWLNLLDDEIEPLVIDAKRPVRVVWSSLWPSRPNDQIHLDLMSMGNETSLKFTLLTPDDLPAASKTGYLRRRINHVLYADLRYSYGQ